MTSDENINPHQPRKHLFWDFWRSAHAGEELLNDDLLQQASLRNMEIPEEKKRLALTNLRIRIEQDEAEGRRLRQRRLYGWGQRMAAVFLGIVLASVFLWKLSGHWVTQTYATNFGEIREVVLPDRSLVSLNANSTLHFKKDWKRPDGIREVWLEGEAFFDVVKDARKPFIIHLRNSKIKVLGTSFNVRAFDDGLVETSVVTGKVAFIPEAGLFTRTDKDTLLLTPNVKAIYSSKTGHLRQEKTNSRRDKAWMEGKLIFRATPFGEIGKTLERTYGKRVRFTNPGTKQCRLTASFENSSLEEVMYLLSRTSSYQYTINDREVVIEGPGCALP